MSRVGFAAVRAMAWAGLCILASCGGGGGGSADPMPPPAPTLPATLGLTLPASTETNAPTSFGSDLPASLQDLSYSWDFGDGSTSNAAQPSHAYDRIGSYTVKLSVRNAAGQQLAAQATLQVQAVARLQGLRCSGPESSGWCWQAPQPWGHVMRSLLFTDADHGWLIGDAGAMLRTIDGGASWTEQFLPEGASLQSIAFVDSRVGWLLSYGGRQLWRTEDGGSTWQARPAPPSSVFGTRLATDAKGTLIVDGASSSLAISEDAAQTWRQLDLRLDGVQKNGTLWVERTDVPPRPTQRYYQSLDGGRYFFVDPAWAASGYAWNFSLFEDGYAIASFDTDTATGSTVQTSLIRNGPQAAWITPSVPAGASSVRVIGAGGMWAQGFSTPGDLQASFLWHSLDAGTWKRVDLPVAAANAGTGPTLLDGATAWLQAASGRLHITRNAGASWQDYAMPSATALAQTLQVDGGGGLVVYDLIGSGPGWYRQRPADQAWVALPGRVEERGNITGLAFFDRQRGLALSFDGKLLDTTDGGRNWRSRDLAPLLGIGPGPVFGAGSIQVLPGGRAWMLSDGRIYRSSDAGLSWTALPTRPDIDGRIVWQQWLDEGHVRLQTRECTLVTPSNSSCGRRMAASDDGGISWRLGDTLFEDTAPVSFLNPLQAIRTEQNRILRTQDGGLTWQQVYADKDFFYINAIAATWADARHAWVLLGDRALRSDDGGLSWKSVSLPLQDSLRGSIQGPARAVTLRFTDAQNGWIVGAGGQVLGTRDGGDSWTVQRSGTQNLLTLIAAVDRTAVWLGGSNGTILATGSGGR